jgi:Tol biopolymer transport system component
VWLFDTERGVPRRLTFDVNDNDVVLSPDGTRVVHQANGPRDGSVVYERRSDATGGEVTLLEESVSEWHHPQDWSVDGRYIAYAVTTTTGLDLRVLPLSGEGPPFDLARTRFAEIGARFSPDSRWVAYQSNETGRMEVYAQPFRGPGPKVRISVGGGTVPRWGHNGRELFYLAPDRRLMVVSVTQRVSTLETGPPRALFSLTTTSGYEPSPDGRRFLVTAVVSEASPISIILNWKPPGD